MSHYQQRLVLEADPATVYAALTTPEGLRGWWTPDCDVPTGVGDTIRVRFGPTRKALRIDRLDPAREVRWTCTEAHIGHGQLARRDEWVGTGIVFRLAAEGDRGTCLDFEHVGLVPAFECYPMCHDGWRHFLESLRQFAATGRGMPFTDAVSADATAPRQREERRA